MEVVPRKKAVPTIRRVIQPSEEKKIEEKRKVREDLIDTLTYRTFIFICLSID